MALINIVCEISGIYFKTNENWEFIYIKNMENNWPIVIKSLTKHSFHFNS